MEFVNTITANLLDLDDYEELCVFKAGLPSSIYEQLRKEEESIKLYNRKIREKNIINKQKKSRELIRYKVLAKAKLEQLCENECVICQTNHIVENMIITDCCKNYYCRNCLIDWMQMPNSNHTCPTCREKYPTTLGFKQRANRRQNIIN